MGIKFRLRVFLKVGEGDVRVPPVVHRVVEDPVEGHEVVRGGEGGAAVVVAGCLSPNHRPHLVVIGRSVVGSSFPKRLARQTEVIWFGQAAKQRTNKLISTNQSQLGLPWSPVLLWQGSLGAAKSM